MYTCEKGITFSDCELEILRMAVDTAEQNQKESFVMTPEIIKLVEIAEEFLRAGKFICYGGTAINNILPEKDRFYNSNEIPDYDFYSSDALGNAKKLADIYHSLEYEDVEAKPSVHVGTLKVFVNGIGIADITQLEDELFNNLYKECIQINGIMYASPQWLRQSMYLELSSPAGDVSRWEKVLKRLILLNKHYPIQPILKCNKNFQRDFAAKHKNETVIFNVTSKALIDHGCVFIGAYADSLYSLFMPKDRRKLLKKIPDFDVLAIDPLKCVNILVGALDFHNIVANYKKHPAIGELISEHYEVRVGLETIAFIYEPVACHSYNVIPIGDKNVKIGTIDTLLTYYLAFLYSSRPYYNKERIMCMSHFLFDVQQRNRLKQKGLLKRFTLECYGTQKTLQSMRENKKEMFEKLKNNPKSIEYQMRFLNYRPGAPAKRAKPARPAKTARTKNFFRHTRNRKYN